MIIFPSKRARAGVLRACTCRGKPEARPVNMKPFSSGALSGAGGQIISYKIMVSVYFRSLFIFNYTPRGNLKRTLQCLSFSLSVSVSLVTRILAAQ